MTEPTIVDQLRLLGSGTVGTISGHHCPLLNEAADMLEFLFGQMSPLSPSWQTRHHWRLRNGWPMRHAIGPSPEAAIRAALKEVRGEQE